MKTSDMIAGLPGEALVREGLADFQAGRCTVPACLVGIARSRFRRAELLADSVSHIIPDPELRLYQLLRKQSGNAYSRYNSLLRELASFENALDRRQSKRMKAGNRQ